MTTTNTCGDGCGWIAGIIAAVAYGSFGVPVRQTKHIDVHPLVLQTFKTVTMFVLSWSVTLVDVTPSWTWWGLVSGALWVLGGTGGIYAIRMAGLAIAVGTWASVMIGVNFVWGILVFREPIHDVPGTLAAFALLTAGLVGMSTYAAPPPINKHDGANSINGNCSSSVEIMERKNPNVWDKQNRAPTEFSNYDRMENEKGSLADALARGDNLVPPESANDDDDDNSKIVFNWRGIQLTQRQAGIAGAVFNGLMTGSSLIPLHYAKAQGYGGANYMISMAGGAVMSNIVLWILMYMHMCRQVALQKTNMTSSSTTTSTATNENHNASSVSTLTVSEQDLPGMLATDLLEQRADQRMPMWHFNELAIPGVIAGILLTIAMFGSIMSVTYLGQGIGNSIVQSKILVSGLWGILWFQEIRGCATVTKWFLSATLTVLGIVWLSYERLLATEGQSEGH